MSTILVVAAIIAVFYVYFKLVTARYWSRLGIPHARPTFLFGNLWRANITENLVFTIENLYRDHGNAKLLGLWMFLKPILLVRDLELIKRILVRDFNSFRDRGFEIDPEMDPLSSHLFMLNGRKWRNLRVKLTPTFTSGKMKMMFPAVVKCGDQLRDYLKTHADGSFPLDARDVLARYTTDVISSCAFGLDTNSLQNPDSEFRKYGKKVATPGLRNLFLGILFSINPSLLKTFKLRLLPDDVTDFFVNAVRDVIQYRETSNVQRNDFLQLLIQLMRAGKLEDVDKTPVDDLTDEEKAKKFTLEDAAAQCFVFFIAGFETSSATMSFALYELALNPDIQSRLQQEIDESLNDSDDQLTYEAICAMQYLDMVVQETLRKYPPLGFLQRKCLKDYDIPELGVTIPSGMGVFIPVLGIHRDPSIYPDPERFDPERFHPERKAERDSCAFLPFGEGPRNCIANRFGLMQVKVGLVSILRKYRVDVCRTTPVPLKFNKGTFTLQIVGALPLSIANRF